MLIYLPYTLLALVLFYFGKSKNTQQWTLIAFSTLCAFFLDIINIQALISLSLYVLLAFGTFKLELPNPLKVLLHTLFFIATVMLLINKVPGFNNPQAIAPTQISSGAVDYLKYLNFDKMFVGMLIFTLLSNSKFKSAVNFSLYQLALISLVFIASFCIALYSGLVDIDPKLHDTILLWVLSNLFITCVVEEVVFRQYLQDGIKKLSNNHWLAISLSGGLFGLVHLPAGLTYTCIATLLGLTYAYIYYQNKNIYQPILLHFLFNFIHFTLFTYPYLIQ